MRAIAVVMTPASSSGSSPSCRMWLQLFQLATSADPPQREKGPTALDFTVGAALTSGAIVLIGRLVSAVSCGRLWLVKERSGTSRISARARFAFSLVALCRAHCTHRRNGTPFLAAGILRLASGMPGLRSASDVTIRISRASRVTSSMYSRGDGRACCATLLEVRHSGEEMVALGVPRLGRGHGRCWRGDGDLARADAVSAGFVIPPHKSPLPNCRPVSLDHFLWPFGVPVRRALAPYRFSIWLPAFDRPPMRVAPLLSSA